MPDGWRQVDPALKVNITGTHNSFRWYFGPQALPKFRICRIVVHDHYWCKWHNHFIRESNAQMDDPMDRLHPSYWLGSAPTFPTAYRNLYCPAPKEAFKKFWGCSRDKKEISSLEQRRNDLFWRNTRVKATRSAWRPCSWYRRPIHCASLYSTEKAKAPRVSRFLECKFCLADA